MCFGPKGEIIEQGTFDDLNNAGGYVSSFSLPRADWTYVPDNNDIVNQDGTATPPSKELGSSDVSIHQLSETAYSADAEAESSRQTGDVQIYLYYVKSVGWLATIIFVVAIIGFVFCVSFPSEQIPS